MKKSLFQKIGTALAKRICRVLFRENIMKPVHSHSKRSGSVLKTSINIQFLAVPSIQFKITYAMKTSAPIPNKPTHPIVSATNLQLTPPNGSPFADLMLHREKLEAALKIAKRENDAFDASRIFSQNPAKRPTRRATSKNQVE